MENLCAYNLQNQQLYIYENFNEVLDMCNKMQRFVRLIVKSGSNVLIVLVFKTYKMLN